MEVKMSDTKFSSPLRVLGAKMVQAMYKPSSK